MEKYNRQPIHINLKSKPRELVIVIEVTNKAKSLFGPNSRDGYNSSKP